MYMQLRGIRGYPLQIVKPDVPTDNHVQVPVPGVLAGVLGKGVACHAIPMPRIGEQRASAIFGVRRACGEGEGLNNAPHEWKGRKREVTKQSVLARKRGGCERKGDWCLRVCRSVLAIE